MKNLNTEKINSLQKHIEKLKTHQTSRTGNKLEAYKEWVKLELHRTEKRLSELKA